MVRYFSRDVMLIKKIAAVSSLAGFGRCGLSVSVPVLSAMGHQACPVPTAVFSSHPLGFSDYAVLDCYEQIHRTFVHWQKEGISFDCCFSGYISSAAQIEVIRDFFGAMRSKSNALVVVDPVMGDHGKIYGNSRGDMTNAYLPLIKLADVITPNLTEACLLLEADYSGGIYEYDKVTGILSKLAEKSGASVVLKGVPILSDNCANYLFEKENGTITENIYRQVPKQYPGTGDIFVSILTGRLLNGDGLHRAFKQASRITTLLAERTFEAGTPEREGICLENNLSILKENL